MTIKDNVLEVLGSGKAMTVREILFALSDENCTHVMLTSHPAGYIRRVLHGLKKEGKVIEKELYPNWVQSPKIWRIV